ncbi:hypothetical protein SCARD494_08442 [Seiridium cardinale]
MPRATHLVQGVGLTIPSSPSMRVANVLSLRYDFDWCFGGGGGPCGAADDDDADEDEDENDDEDDDEDNDEDDDDGPACELWVDPPDPDIDVGGLFRFEVGAPFGVVLGLISGVVLVEEAEYCGVLVSARFRIRKARLGSLRILEKTSAYADSWVLQPENLSLRSCSLRGPRPFDKATYLSHWKMSASRRAWILVMPWYSKNRRER